MEETQYPENIQTIREREYPLLDSELYLDHAGSALFPRSLVKQSSEVLLGNLYGNPHAQSPASLRTEHVIESTRLKVLQLFKADPAEYAVVFVPSATAGIKLVGEGLQSQPSRTQYRFLSDAHTSIVGLRELADDYEMVLEDDMEQVLRRQHDGCALITWPGQSNFSGQRYPTEKWLKIIRSNKSNNYTMLDAAALCSTSPPDLSKCGPDIMVVSFYKIFGYPDLGALIVRKTAGHEFFKYRRYFGGGTVEALTAVGDFAPRHADLSARLEDGTQPFHSIIALSCAFEIYDRIYGSFDRISCHTNKLAGYLYHKLQSLKHSNGQPACELYSKGEYDDSSKQGATVTFNLKDHNGEWIGYADVEKLATEAGISLRPGALCNSGANTKWVGMSQDQIKENHAHGHVCSDDLDVINGTPTGAVRASFGPYNSQQDADRLIVFLKEYYINQRMNRARHDTVKKTQYIASITLFPIKSCGGFSVPAGMEWEVTEQGLKWDREFCMVNIAKQSVMSLKKFPRMAMVSPLIDESASVLHVSYPHLDPIQLPLLQDTGLTQGHEIQTTICGDNVQVELFMDPAIVQFCTNAVGVECTIGRFPVNSDMDATQTRFFKPHINGPIDHTAAATAAAAAQEPPAAQKAVPIAMSNSSPLLLISEQSIRQLSQDSSSEIDPAVFRANIAVGGHSESLAPYAEDLWKTLYIGEHAFEILGPCRRCNMVGVDAKTGEHNNKPYLALHKTRKLRGQLFFGQHMTLNTDSVDPGRRIFLRVGDAIKHSQYVHTGEDAPSEKSSKTLVAVTTPTSLTGTLEPSASTTTAAEKFVSEKQQRVGVLRSCWRSMRRTVKTM